MAQLRRQHLLAAEMFGYSYANYLDHLGIGHERFEHLMPDDARTLEQAVAEDWNLEQVAASMDVDTDTAAALMTNARQAIEVVDASNPAESFRISVRHLIERAATEGLDTDEAVEALVVQICYRASDLSCLLTASGQPLSKYCADLRREADDHDQDEDNN